MKWEGWVEEENDENIHRDDRVEQVSVYMWLTVTIVSPTLTPHLLSCASGVL